MPHDRASNRLLVLGLIFVTSVEAWGQGPATRQVGNVFCTSFATEALVLELLGDASYIGNEELHISSGLATPYMEDPEHWMPEGSQITRYPFADNSPPLGQQNLWILQGKGYDKWIPLMVNPETERLEIVERVLAEGFTVDPVILEGSAGPEEDERRLHSYTWLDPLFTIAQARVITSHLIDRWPKYKQMFHDCNTMVTLQLEILHARLQGIFAELKPRLGTSHDAYRHFAARYGLPLVNFELDPTRIPTPEELAALSAALQGKVDVFVWHLEPSPGVDPIVRETLGVPTVVFEPLGTLPGFRPGRPSREQTPDLPGRLGIRQGLARVISDLEAVMQGLQDGPIPEELL